MAKYKTDDTVDLELCSFYLNKGGLVAFPTETVYGLGASVHSTSGLRDVFSVKGRPTSDPLILHVSSAQMALDIWDLTDQELSLINDFINHFWPGPLTIVARKRAHISDLVSAGGAFVGIRHPSHPIAQAFLKKTGVPVAAPSANRFGHVSPTCARHVMDDFFNEDKVWVIAPEGNPELLCTHGIESTVIKVERNRVHIVRYGVITSQQLKTVCPDLQEHQEKKSVQIADGPGQLLTHYAPRQDAFYIPKELSLDHLKDHLWCHFFKKCALIDFAQRYVSLKKLFHFYVDLSSKNDENEAAYKLFYVLRFVEEQPGVECILLPEFLDSALKDRVWRACSGRSLESFFPK